MSDLKAIEISDVLGLSEPLSKLIESVSRGIGKVYEPTHIKKIAKAKSEEIKMISNTINENIVLPINYKNGEIEMNSTDFEELVKRTGDRLVFQEIQKQQNLESVIGHAYTELEEEIGVSEEKVETDWILRFMKSVEDISDREMQELWGRILAEEVKQPETYSFRTLDILRNISTFEARKFELISEFIITIDGSTCIYNNEDLFEKYDINYGDILLLEECGFINSNQVSLTVKIGEDIDSMIYNSKILGLVKGTTSEHRDIKYSIYLLSEAGKQLYNSLYRITSGSKNYIIDAIKEIIKPLSEVDYIVSIHEINSINLEGEINYNTENILHKKNVN